jgi:hypothetical protein
MSSSFPYQEDLVASFRSSYEVVNQRNVTLYPRKTFQRNGIPSPRQYIAFKRLIERFGGNTDFLNSNLATSDLRDDHLFLADDFGSYFQGRRVKLTFVSGYFLYSGPKKRKKMIPFIKGLAKNNVVIEIYTQDKTLPGAFFDNEPDATILKEHITIKVIPYRIDIHYTLLEDLDNRCETHFFIEYPHTELFLFRLGINFSYADIREKFHADPETVIAYLLYLKKGDRMEKFFCGIKRVFPFLSKITPNFGIAFDADKLFRKAGKGP